MSGRGTICEPLFTKARLDRSARAQRGCSMSAFITAGTSRLVVGRHCSTASNQAPGSKRGCSSSFAPTASAGRVWMHSPPTWNSGSTESTRARPSSPCAATAASALACMAAAVCIAPLGWPVVPLV